MLDPENTFRIALVQPLSHKPGQDEKNIPDAIEYIRKAAAGGAHFVCFPENYPGPWRIEAFYDPIPTIAAAAKEHKIHVIFGTLELIDEKKETAYNLTCMAYPDGKVVKKRRTHPRGPYVYTGGKAWEFQYVAGDDFPVFDTEHGKVGLAMCSEIYIPEVARAFVLRGAELLFFPAGVDKQPQWYTWRTLIWARAIENLALVVTTQNMFNHQERGLAMIASPEQILFESTAVGLSVIEVSLDPIRELRAGEDKQPTPGASAVKRGLLGDVWQRPELYKHIYSKK